MKKTRKIKVIGSGGIGVHLIEPLSRYLSCSDDNCEITVIDGDTFEERNRERQRFVELENKAMETVNTLSESFPKIHFRAIKKYVVEDNIISMIRENDIVFLCVDNHATRKLVSERCGELDDVLLISGGNDYTDGDVLIYLRKNGKDITQPLTALPEINDYEDENPGDVDDDRQGCQEEIQEGSAQLLFMNLDIASLMLNCYYAHEQGKLDYYRVFTDISTHARRVVRN